MTCTSRDIKELLPAYRSGMLSPADNDRIEKHLSACEDCAGELELLGILAAEPVPDPGEAFWAAMPGRVFRVVQAHARQETLQGSPFGLGRFLSPRLAWAAGAVALIAVVVMLLNRPAPPNIARTALPGNGSSYENHLPLEPIDLAELTDSEIDSVDLWATEELALLQEEIIDTLRNNADISLDDRLAEMDYDELEQLDRMLDTPDEEG